MGSQATSTQQAVSKKQKRSAVWEHFDYGPVDVKGVGIINRAICKYCKHHLAGSGNGTGHLRRHADKCAPDRPNDPRQTQLGQIRGPGGQPQMSTFIYSHARMREGLALYTAASEQPFTFGQDPNFEEFQQTCVNPQFQRVSRNTVRKDAIKLYTDQKNQIIYNLASFNCTVACTSDLWSGGNHMSYYCVTAHYIDENWMLQKRIIAFRMMEYPHSGQSIYQHVMNVFREYGISEKIFSITFDNASSNTAAIEVFKRHLKPPYGGHFYHVRCVCHIINLIVQDGLLSFNAHIHKIRSAIMFIRSSDSRVQDFLHFCEANGLSGRRFATDTKNRWNTTYLMLASCENYELCISEYVNGRVPTDMVLADDDWKIASKIMEFLKVFYDATTLLSGVYYPTSCIVLSQLIYITENFEKYRADPVFTASIEVMEQKFKKYWEDVPPLFYLATCMDPRMKVDIAVWSLESIATILKVPIDITSAIMTTQLTNMYNLYESKFGVNTPSPASSSSTAPSSKGKSGFISKMLNQRGKQKVGTTSPSELFKYLETNFVEYLTEEEIDNFDILSWWKLHQRNFPVLSIMARDLLTPPASTVASESAFSAGNRVLSERRTRLNEKSLDALMCVKDWNDARKRIQDTIPEDEDLSKEFSNIHVNDDEY